MTCKAKYTHTHFKTTNTHTFHENIDFYKHELMSQNTYFLKYLHTVRKHTHPWQRHAQTHIITTCSQSRVMIRTSKVELHWRNGFMVMESPSAHYCITGMFYRYVLHVCFTGMFYRYVLLGSLWISTDPKSLLNTLIKY